MKKFLGKHTSRKLQFAIGICMLGLVLANTVRSQEIKYGVPEALPEIHVFIDSIYKDMGKHYDGEYANKGSGVMADIPRFVPISAYINIASQIHPVLRAETEFELYEGEKVKICTVRTIWSPREEFNVSIGKDFVPIGLQDINYYPTARWRMFRVGPELYRSVMRYSGWWDAGLRVFGKLSLGMDALFSEQKMYLKYDIAVTNGPGFIPSTTTDSSKKKIKFKSTDGYMYEKFIGTGRQAYDNNKDKSLTYRLSFSPIQGMEMGGSVMTGKYDPDDKYDFGMTFGSIHYTTLKEKLDIIAEYGKLMVEAPSDQNVGDEVNSNSYYIACGYKFMDEDVPFKINYIQPVVRYESLDPWEEYKDYGGKDGSRKIWSFGINISPLESWLIKVGYHKAKEKDNLDHNGFAISNVVTF